eukprot:13633018-Ditylum_brightwellii.AAC.1
MDAITNNKNNDKSNNKTSSSQDDKDNGEGNEMDTAYYDFFSNKLMEKMKSICDKSPIIPLKISMYHKDITIKIITKKYLEENLDLYLNDNSYNTKDIKDMGTELVIIEGILQQIRENCATASIAYDNYGHYSKMAERIREKNYSLAAFPPILDHKCGGLTGGSTPKICLANSKNYKVKAHKKTKSAYYKEMLCAL